MTDKNIQASKTVIFKPGEITLPAHERQGFLTVVLGGGADLGKSMPVGEQLEIGRSKACGLTLLDVQVSSRHARVTHVPQGTYLLEDLGSTNGTQVNRMPLKTARELQEGDKIFLGKTVLRFTMADAMDLNFHDELAQLVHTDTLTGLESKHCFDDALEVALNQVLDSHGVLSLLMMDMDGLKGINDAHGHLFGAHVIAETGRLIGRLLDDRGRSCRFGGDEFTAMLPGMDKPSAVQVAEEIRRQLEEAKLEMDGITLLPTISIGVASCPEDGCSVATLTAAADRALYRAKRAGKNRVST